MINKTKIVFDLPRETVKVELSESDSKYDQTFDDFSFQDERDDYSSYGKLILKSEVKSPKIMKHPNICITDFPIEQISPAETPKSCSNKTEFTNLTTLKCETIKKGTKKLSKLK